MSPFKTLISAFHQDQHLTSPRGWTFNLAIFRVVFLGFVALPWALRCFHWAVNVLPNLPDTVWKPISFYRLIPLDVLHNIGLVRTLCLINIIFIALGLIGFRTRFSTGLASLLSLYLFGLMENQGKVDHFHHVIWLMAMLAVGDSGKVLSMDALGLAIKSAGTGIVGPQFEHFDALWAFRYIWILLGLAYLGPGIAKLVSALTAGWASAANLQNTLLMKWLELSWYDPSFVLPLRVDRMPHWMLEALGWGAILFEVCFVVTVLFRFCRPAVALAGVAFHVGNGIFLGIWFTTLLPAYACLLDWTAIARSLHRRSKISSFVLYDEKCRLCRRTIAILKCSDLFDALTPVSVSSGDPLRTQFPSVTDEMLARDLYFVHGNETSVGYDAYAQITQRVIVLWPLGFIMRLKSVATAGRRFYTQVAQSRHCALATTIQAPRMTCLKRSNLIHLIGTALVLGQFFVTGINLIRPHSQRILRSKRWFSPVAQLVDGVASCRWPFDIYPTFAGIASGEIRTFEYRWGLSDNSERRVSPTAYWQTFRNSGLTWNIMTQLESDQASEANRARALDLAKALWQAELPNVRGSAVNLRLYQVRYRLQSAPGPLAKLIDQTPTYTFPIKLLLTGN